MHKNLAPSKQATPQKNQRRVSATKLPSTKIIVPVRNPSISGKRETNQPSDKNRADPKPSTKNDIPWNHRFKKSQSKSIDLDRSTSLTKRPRQLNGRTVVPEPKPSTLPKFNSDRTLSPCPSNSQKEKVVTIINDYRVIKEIGHGSYAAVFEAEYVPTRTPVAIKIYKKSSLTQTRENSIKHELHVLLNLDHPNVVKFIDCFSDRDNIYLVMELIKGKNLYASFKLRFKDVLQDPGNKIIRKGFVKNIFRQLTSAVAYLHSKKVNHRDIKLDNIVYDPDKKQIKLIDFGFSKKIDPQKTEKLYCGTPSYMSPEAILKEEFKTLSADIWAMGVVYFAMLFFEFPFSGSTDKELYHNIVNQQPRYQEWASSNDTQLLELMLAKNWKTRIDSQTLANVYK